MSLSQLKREILESMYMHGKAMDPAEIAVDTKMEVKRVNLNVLGLIRIGYASSPEKGKYTITKKGKNALGVPDTDRQKAVTILSYASDDKPFVFYVEIGKPLDTQALSLRDFADKLGNVDVASIEFHVNRKDFETWANGLGDSELAKRIELLRLRSLVGEDLRRQLFEIVEQRFVELTALAGQTGPPQQPTPA